MSHHTPTQQNIVKCAPKTQRINGGRGVPPPPLRPITAWAVNNEAGCLHPAPFSENLRQFRDIGLIMSIIHSAGKRR